MVMEEARPVTRSAANRSLWHLLSGLAVVVLVLAACTAGSGSQTPGVSAGATRLGTTAPSQPSSASAGASSSAGAAFQAGPLAAGTYSVGTSPAIGFTIDDGWVTSSTDPDAFDLQKDPAYIAVGTVAQVFDADRNGVDAGTDPAAAAALFAANTSLTVTVPQPLSIGGANGVTFDVTTASATPVFGFQAGGGQVYRFTSDVTVRVNLVASAGTLLVVTVEAPPGLFEAALALAQPVIDSMTFG